MVLVRLRAVGSASFEETMSFLYPPICRLMDCEPELMISRSVENKLDRCWCFAAAAESLRPLLGC